MSFISQTIDSIAAGAGAAGGNIAGAAVSGLMQDYLNKRQNDRAVANWNMQNEYNTPAAQMKRMTDAGINPAAAAAGISGAGSFASPVAPAASGSAPDLSNLGSATMTPIQEKKTLAESQNQLNESQTQLNQSNAAVAEEEANYKRTYNTYAEKLLQLELSERQAKIDNLVQDTETKFLQGCLFEDEADYKHALAHQVNTLTPLIADLNRVQIRDFNSQIQKRNAEIKLLQQQVLKTMQESKNLGLENQILTSTADIEATRVTEEMFKAVREALETLEAGIRADYVQTFGVTPDANWMSQILGSRTWHRMLKKYDREGVLPLNEYVYKVLDTVFKNVEGAGNQLFYVLMNLVDPRPVQTVTPKRKQLNIHENSRDVQDSVDAESFVVD